MSKGKDSLYEPAWNVHESSRDPGEPVAEDGYEPRNKYAKPHWSGTMPSMRSTDYPIIDNPVIIRKKQEMRNALKEEYAKQIYDPYRFAASRGGMPFDSGVHRYITLLRTQAQFIRPTPRITFLGLSVYVFPILALYFHLSHTKAEQEKVLRSGQVAYEDRTYKFMI